MFNKWVSWGGTAELGSHRHILRHYHRTAQKMGVQSLWLPDEPGSREHLTPGTVVFVWDICCNHIGPAMPGVLYVTHNLDGSHQLCQTVEPNKILRLQVYTNDAQGEEWAPFRLYHREWQTLFQPWGTDILPEEFDDPVFTPTSTEIVFIGAVWSDTAGGTELGNKEVIGEIKRLCAEKRLNFRHIEHVSDHENAVLVRGGRLAPGFAGSWQVDHNYLPCRVFKNVSYGVLGVTNVPALAGPLGIPTGPVASLFNWALALRRGDYVALTRQQQKFVAKYTYRDSLIAINRAFEEQDAF